MNTKTHTHNYSTIKEICEAYGLKPPTHPSRNKLWGEIKLPENYKKPKAKHTGENIMNKTTSNNQYLNIKEMCKAYNIDINKLHIDPPIRRRLGLENISDKNILKAVLTLKK